MVFIGGLQWVSGGGREEAGREEGKRRRRQKKEKGGMLSFGTENCTHLKCDSGSHYTKDSFVSPLFAILHWCVTCSLVSLGHHLHLCEKGRKWDLYNMDAQNKYIQ